MNQNSIYCYLSCVESLKKGVKHGVWVDCTWEISEINQEIERMLATSVFSQNTDWHLTGFDVPEGFESFLSDQTSLETLHEMAKFIEHFGDLGVALLNYLECDILEAKDAINERYQGHFKSVEQFVKRQINRGYPLPDEIKQVIDYQKLWRNWQCKRYMALTLKNQTGVWIFHR